MRKPNARTIERFKSFLLVVLFLTTVLLLYFFWENASRSSFHLPEIIYTVEEEEAPKVVDTVIPTEITVGFGNGVYTIISDGGESLWKQALTELKKVGRSGKQPSSLLVSDISEETYKEAMSIHYPSIQFQFQYDIPFQEFCKYYELPQAQSYEKIEGVSTIAWSGKGTESILIYQRSGNKYYAIVSDQDYTDFRSMIEEIETRSVASYYPANTFFGSGVKSTALLPLSLQSDLLEVSYEQEGDQPEDIKVRKLAESFFGESFDFVRSLKDAKGNFTYMYGYGRKIFNVYENGIFEYKEEIAGSSGSSSPRFFDSLDIALKFVAAHGSWNSLDGTDMSAYLKKVIPIDQDKRKGYKFIFGMKIGSQNIYFENSTPIIVDVVNGQVTYYRRDMIDFDQNAAEAYSSGEPETTFDPVTVLTENYDFIYDKLSAAGIVLPPKSDREEAFDDIVNEIRSMEIGYVRPEITEDREMVLKPCYRIYFGKNITLYFDLFEDAAPIGADMGEYLERNIVKEDGA